MTLTSQNVTWLLLTALVVTTLYLTRDVKYSNMFVKNQVIMKQEQTENNDPTSNNCDIFSGKWIYDNTSYPLYKERQCSFMQEELACEKYGRKDLNYQHWRWQPHHCNLPRFNGTLLLEKMRGKKILFVGDSVNRNQWASFLCLIDSSLSPSSKKYLIETGNLRYFHDIGYNTTIGFYWSPFLVESNCDDPRGHQKESYVVRIMSIEKHGRQWNDADILIFDSYAWWLNEGTRILWGSFGSSDAIYKRVEMPRHYEMGLNTWSDWLEMNINTTKTKMFFMSASPYNPNRDEITNQCYEKSEPMFDLGYMRYTINENMTRIAESAIDKLDKRGIKVEYLRITKMSIYRREAHPSIYRFFYKSLTKENLKDPNSYADCVHWCLPGVPDVWNQILYTYIMKS